jgi:hypothetical protein
MAIPALILLFVGYFILQLCLVKAKTPGSDLIKFGLFTVVGFYISVLLFIEENPLPRNYLGWFYIVFLTTFISLTGIRQLRKVIKNFKQACIGTEISMKRIDILSNISDEVANDFFQHFNNQGYDIHFHSDLFHTLADSIWRRQDLFKEMQYWINERKQSLLFKT